MLFIKVAIPEEQSKNNPLQKNLEESQSKPILNIN